jgi:hypothetical protein
MEESMLKHRSEMKKKHRRKAEKLKAKLKAARLAGQKKTA